MLSFDRSYPNIRRRSSNVIASSGARNKTAPSQPRKWPSSLLLVTPARPHSSPAPTPPRTSRTHYTYNTQSALFLLPRKANQKLTRSRATHAPPYSLAPRCQVDPPTSLLLPRRPSRDRGARWIAAAHGRRGRRGHTGIKQGARR